MNKIIIWGTGGTTEIFLEKGWFAGNDIIGFADSDGSKKEFKGYKVYSPDELLDMMGKIDYLVICSRFYLDILKQCIQLKLDWDKIVVTENEGEVLCKEVFERLQEVSPQRYNEIKYCKFIHTKRNEYDVIDKELRVGRERFSGREYLDEYFRFRTFELVAQEIKRNGVKGAAAELGVFRGVFSALINDIFRDRQIFLFDTFEGFEKNEAENELVKGRCDEGFLEAHVDTNEDIVKAAMPYPEQLRICKGFFPESIPRELYDEKFAFVSLDVDFEESTYQGLRFFYPRMSDGGYIFIHDYRTFFLEGVDMAVKRFEKDENIKLKCVPIADRAGTLIILK